MVVPLWMEEALGWTRVCKSVLSHWYSIALSNQWPNRSHHVCVNRKDPVPSRHAACFFLSSSLARLQPPLHGVNLCWQTPNLGAFGGFFLMLHARTAPVSIRSMLQWFQGQVSALAWEHWQTLDDSYDWNCLVIKAQYRSLWMQVIGTTMDNISLHYISIYFTGKKQMVTSNMSYWESFVVFLIQLILITAATDFKLHF